MPYEDVIWMLQSSHIYIVKVIMVAASYPHFQSTFIISNILQLKNNHPAYPVISSSSLESNYAYAQWLEKRYSIIQKEPTPFFGDNQSTIRLVKNPKYHTHTKHIEINITSSKRSLKRERSTFYIFQWIISLQTLLQKSCCRRSLSFFVYAWKTWLWKILKAQVLSHNNYTSYRSTQ